MDDKQDLINTVKESTLSQEIKDDLVSRIASQGATRELAKEVADLLDLGADVLDLEAEVADQKAQAYDGLATELENADKQEEAGVGQILDEADKQLSEIEKQAGTTPQPQAPAVTPSEPQPQAQ